MSIPIGVVGRVPGSVHSNHFVRVEDDRKQTGGFLIFHWWDGSENVFDDWVLASDLDRYFEEMNQKDGRVEWPHSA